MTTLRNLAVVGALGIPLLLWAHPFGPDPLSTGVPGEQSCAAAGCHTGTAVNAGGGSAAVTFPGGMTYTPGVRQTLTVTISDPTARVFGFQLTVRLGSNNKTQAGSLTASNNTLFVQCSNASDSFSGTDKVAATCPANRPIESAQQTSPKDAVSGAASWTIQWDPPATDVGEIKVYVAGNGANNNGQNTGDKIYTANYTLTPAAGGGGGGAKPAITEGGVTTAGACGAGTTVAPGSWIEIYGTNFAAAAGDWSKGFNGNNAPTTTNGVSVTIGGKAAFVWIANPTQLNVQVPADTGIGSGIPVIVKNAAGESNTLSITVAARAPGLLSPPSFKIGNNQYLAALHADGTFVAPAGSIAGASPAKAGETIVAYGVGFGAVTPANPPGVITTNATNELPNFSWRFGDVTATVLFKGLVPGNVGLYQFNITIPAGITGTAVPISVTTDGVPLSQTLVIPIQ
jgi:uncharacterized protein (TIGR03437 family)